MYEKAVFILEGQGATTIWNDGGKKHTLESAERQPVLNARLNTLAPTSQCAGGKSRFE